ncbi:MAG TPA: cytochrome P450 [Bryobacteraceae bacterium]|nr:cytochrome P450 [Bryobacteraceae bacterium]
MSAPVTHRFPPGPRGLPLVGVVPLFRRDPAGFLQGLAREYGAVVHFLLMRRHAFLFTHPDHVREILVNQQANFTKSRILQRSKLLLGEGLLTSEGEAHLRQRRMAQPAFYRERLQSYSEIMSSYALRTRERWQPGTTLDMQSEMMRLTLSIVARALFGADAEGDAADVGRAMTEVIELFRFMMLPFSEHLDRYPLPHRRRFDRAKAVLDRAVYRIIAERRGALAGRGRPAHAWTPAPQGTDLLGTLLAMRDDDGSGMTDQQLRDEIMTLFIAGHETTAIALTWTWYLLSRNPECERRLHEEIDSVLRGRTPCFDDLPNLRYTDMVISESLRLYPPAWSVTRMAKDDCEIGGVHVPSGSVCIACQWVTHRDERFFPDPERFDPERWLPEARESRPRFSYFPFGGGARVCIGERFAWMEMMLAIAAIAQRWRLRQDDARTIDVMPMLTLRPKETVSMITEKREIV